MGEAYWAEVDIDEVVDVREEAIQVDVGDQLVWLPRSCVRGWEDLQGSGTIEIVERVAIKKELV